MHYLFDSHFPELPAFNEYISNFTFFINKRRNKDIYGIFYYKHMVETSSLYFLCFFSLNAFSTDWTGRVQRETGSVADHQANEHSKRRKTPIQAGIEAAEREKS